MKELLNIIRRHKAGEAVGIYSVCSAHPVVLEAAMRRAQAAGTPVLIEATSNQVNQDGGYTGMTPADFFAFVSGIAARVGLPPAHLLLGGDHLGPNAWQREPAAQAMDKADVLIEQYVAAGFRKIHLDCSMACGGDPVPLAEDVVAARAARLCAVAERTWARVGGEAPLYIIGTEVPVPGGAQEDLHELQVTPPAAAAGTIAAHRQAFLAAGLDDAWTRIIGLVVQPGVEFDHHKVIDYRPAAATALSQYIENESLMVYEAHSTDYQTPANLRALVRDHFAILKVGPGATFALRETLWALADIERAWLGAERSADLKGVMLQAMRDKPKYWQGYYTDPAREHIDLQYSLSDRIRYYWPEPAVQEACRKMLANLDENPPPLTLLSQYLPGQYAAVREGALAPDTNQLLQAGVSALLAQYEQACADQRAEVVQ
ncbi:D-tagatose-1,6-bisphosphate aldolase subunit GatZ/KbaZ [Pseudoduganella lurida]|uniref:D-tagatose-1,6-bisphosphate aldolase subunit GatZ/KbaZ n=1 Tax=Pseudoduganella lurida TaxID=1036180 RepID=A0A562RDW2_9BURK|nr:D-tagatose-bisphosphate aldolase, class II, non-catalytic subunit [Pseudoduganella lurida]TWI67277.1 D-tagatose-1,6-bisphosphate aldolase subunit GatZ/KbaZ [Pseudoduganella lurida]